MPITHTDGAQYFSQAEVEGIVKDRVKKLDETIDGHVQKIKSLEPQLAQIQTLSTEVNDWKGKTSKAEAAAARLQAAMSHGITDTETLDLLQIAHERAMGRVADESKRVDFATYLGEVKKDPTLLPKPLQGVFQGQPAADAGKAAGQGQGQGAGEQSGAEQPKADPARPAWASSGNGQRTVTPGATPELGQRIAGAKTMAELEAISAERRGARA